MTSERGQSFLLDSCLCARRVFTGRAAFVGTKSTLKVVLGPPQRRHCGS